MTSKVGSLRLSRRQPLFIQKREHLFQIRKSLAEYVDNELENFGAALYYQRIYILAKNNLKRFAEPRRESGVSLATMATVATVGTVATVATVGTVGTVGTTGTAGTAGTTGTVGTVGTAATAATAATDTTVLTVDLDAADRISIQSGKRSFTNAPSEDAVDAVVTVTQFDVADSEKLPKTQKFQDTESAPDKVSARGVEDKKIVVEKPRGFFEIFMDKLHEVQTICQKKIYTPDPLGGLFLFMGEYTILILEGCEDMIGVFCHELMTAAADFWTTNRIFQIEDKLNETFFEHLIARTIPAAFINEKFPTSTPNDEYLMSKQHLIIKQKIKTICEMLAADLRIKYEPTEGDETPVRRRFSTTLPTDPYRKLLPEMQRLDLVLNSNRFYSTLDAFANIYGTTPRDDEILFWPVPYNYLPPNIFCRTPYDINLTFGDYGMENEKRSSSIVSNAPDFGLDDEGGEEAGAKKEEG